VPHLLFAADSDISCLAQPSTAHLSSSCLSLLNASLTLALSSAGAEGRAHHASYRKGGGAPSCLTGAWQARSWRVKALGVSMSGGGTDLGACWRRKQRRRADWQIWGDTNIVALALRACG